MLLSTFFATGEEFCERNIMTKRTIRAMMALVAALCMALTGVAGGASAAQAAEPLYVNGSGMWQRFLYDGVVYALGTTMHDADGNNVYCIESGVHDEESYEKAEPVPDSSDARLVAWLAQRYRGRRESETHVAISILVHDLFEAADKELWAARRADVLRKRPDIAERVERLRAEAERSVPRGMSASYTVYPGLRNGVVYAVVTNGAGAAVADVPFTLRLEGPAVFDKTGTAEISGVSSTERQEFAWTATGTGEVQVHSEYEHAALRKLISSQDFVQFGGSVMSQGDGVKFSVRRQFIPAIATEVPDKLLQPGSEVRDVVSSGLGDGDSWADGVSLTADGYYFDGLASDDLREEMRPESHEGIRDFLARLALEGHVPQAYGRASFDGPGQRHEVRAVTEQDGDEPYHARSGFGTWVWAFERSRQDESDRSYLANDVVTPFLEAAETQSIRHRLHVESTVTDHSAAVGGEISDRITVSGFPDDHGDFHGSEAYGFGPDQATAQVSVYWAGDEMDAGDMDAYKPSGSSPPAQDDHHRLVGTWNYPAKNGLIKVGGGAPDASGEPVSIIADRPGWYVFVYVFSGDDRVEPATSSYDDAWERTRVTKVVPQAPALTTAVQPAVVGVGEPFRDTANITGPVRPGDYVTFSAYEPVGFGEQAGEGKLLDEVRVELDHTKTRQTVTSPQARSLANGYVYWKVTLRSADGDVLDSHPLGVEGEVTEVVASADLSTRARPLGAVDTAIWDEITIRPGSRDGHVVNVPQGAAVSVSLYRNTGDAVNGTLVGVRRYALTDTQVRDANSADGLTFRAEGFQVGVAGEYYWVAAVRDQYGNELACGQYGDPNERTSVHRYSTDVDAATLARHDGRYESSRHVATDVLHVEAWERGEADVSMAIGQTPEGVTYRWQLWRQGDGDVSTDRMVKQGDITPMPQLPFDDAAGRVSSALDVESPQWAIEADWPTGTYYYRLHVVDAAGDTVAYLPAREARESFAVVSLATKVSKQRWFDGERVTDTLILDGVLPAGSTYEAQLWRCGGLLARDEQIGTTGRQPIPVDAGMRELTTASLPAPDPGRYYWKTVIASGDRPGEPLIVDGSRIPEESFEVIRVTTEASEGGAAPTEVHDVAFIDGGAPAGTLISFELFRASSDDDVRKDESVAVTERVPVAEGAKLVQSADIRVEEPGEYYWRETLWSEQGDALHVGAARVAEESVTISDSLPLTGIGNSTVVALAVGVVAAVIGVVGLGVASRRRV